MIGVYLFFVFIASVCSAEIRRVPEDYPTIQSALDAIEIGGDTILVEMGEYAETLTAPAVPFSIIGNVEPDTGDFPRPVIDPSLLPPGQRGASLILPEGSNCRIENIRFRNRNPMSPYTNLGGVRYAAAADSALFRYCVFDSVYTGIFQPDSFFVWPEDSLQGITILENCIFRDDSGSGIFMQNGPLIATNCLFTGGWGWAQANCGPNSTIQGCTFQDHDRYLLSAIGINTRVNDCVFGPSGEHGFWPVELYRFSGTLENCVFTNLDLATSYFLLVTVEAGTIIANNIFTEIRPTGPSGQERCAVRIEGECPSESPVIFENNIITACSTGFPPKALETRTCVNVMNNRIVANEPDHRWALQVSQHSFPTTFSRNIVSENGAGLRNLDTFLVDARDNWWGDSTGPRASTNPFGLGDSVSDNVLYDPWTTDTLDWISSVGDELPVIPESFEMNVFPNPFNSSATLVLRVPEPTVLRIELFDIMGRRIKELFSGAVAIEQRVTFNATDLPSGVYFARATDVYFNRQLVATKLLLIR